MRVALTETTHSEMNEPMEPRIKNPAMMPGALEALHALHQTTQKTGVPRTTFELMNMRASQINGCSVCVDIHWRALRKLGEKDERIFAISAWREAPYYSEAERAALALTEATSRLGDRADPVPDEIWKDAARHYDEPQLAALVMSIGLINLFNRLNAATRQPGGPHLEQIVANAFR
jgi:AhpD family alkylhydroperoxidase